MIKKIILTLIFMLIFSCSNSDNILTINLSAEVNTLNPKTITDVISTQVNTLINEGLLGYDDEKNEYYPLLCESYIENSNTISFKIRDDIYWSDGSKITVDDFIYGFEIALRKDTLSKQADMLFDIKGAREFNKGEIGFENVGIKKIDDKSFIIELENYKEYFKYILTLPISYPIKKGTYTTTYGSNEKELLYSGSFVVKSINNTEVLLEKNPMYYNKDKIYLNNIRIIFVNNFQVVDNLIQNDELDISRIENKYLDKYINNELHTFYNGRLWYLEYNLDKDIFKDIYLRKAITSSIDRKEYVEKLKKDGSKIAKSLVSDILYAEDRKYRDIFDDTSYIDESKYLEYIKKSAYNGQEITLLTGNSDPEIQEGEYLQNILKTKLGINVKLLSVPFKERLNLTRSKKFDIVLNTWSPKYNDVSSMLIRWYKYMDKEHQEKFDLANSINSNERYKLFNDVEKYLIFNSYVSPIYFSVENLYVSKKIKNLKILPLSNILDIKYSKIDK